MRSAVLVVLAACSFQAGRFQQGIDDANGPDDTGGSGSDDANIDLDAAIDGPDANPDAAPSPIHVRMIDLVDAQVAGGPHTDFPLLVSLSTTWLRTTANGGEVASASGFDIHFSADALGAVPLAHEIETYVPTTGVLVAWVKVPALAAATVIYIHDGDPSITASTETPTAVWTNGYELVMHLDGTADSTTKATTTPTNVAAAAGKIDGGHAFDGATSIISLGSATAVDEIFVGGGTAEAWFYADTAGENSYGRIFDKGHPSGWTLMMNNVEYSNALMFFHYSSGGQGAWATPNNSVTLDAWHHAVAVYNKDSAANQPVIYIDGVVQTLDPYASPSGTMSADASFTLELGNRDSQDRTFNGVLDEARLSSVSRSGDWILTSYRNQADPAAFYTVTSVP